MKKLELLNKSRETMMSAVQIYNNPLISFKSESFITLAIISWTYLLHCYYSNEKVDYRCTKNEGGRKTYFKTKNNAYRFWSLDDCLNCAKSPIDNNTANNLRFLIGIRHEIEHQMTHNIDNTISAKIQACSINFNYYVKKLFGNNYGIDKQLGIVVQFAPIQPEQKEHMLNNERLSKNVVNYICSFEEELTDSDIENTKYAYRLQYKRINTNRKCQADQVVEFISENNDETKLNGKIHMLIRETEKKKLLAREVVEIMKNKGYTWFNAPIMTAFWKNELGERSQYGIFITRSQWMWYENWLPVIEGYCEKHDKIKS